MSNTGDWQQYKDQLSSDPEISEDESWRIKRLGNVTASQFATFVKQDKAGGYILSQGEMAKNLIYKIAWERLVLSHNLGDALERLEVDSKSIQHGNMYEGAAVKRYEEFTGIEIDYINRYNAYTEDIGGTPDGYVNKDGLVEVKVPYNGGNHLRHFLTHEMYNKDHLIQVQGYLMITKRKWCDYVTYDADMPKGLDIAVTRIDRDEIIIKGIELVIDKVVNELNKITATLKGLKS